MAASAARLGGLASQEHQAGAFTSLDPLQPFAQRRLLICLTDIIRLLLLGVITQGSSFTVARKACETDL